MNARAAASSPPDVLCTCAGCPPKGHRIIVHAFQEKAWTERRVYEPCPHPPEDCCGCMRPATEEDLLCDDCRERSGISRLDEQRITAFLAGALSEVEQ